MEKNEKFTVAHGVA